MKRIISAVVVLFSLPLHAEIERIAASELVATHDMGRAVGGVLQVINRHHYRPVRLDNQLSGALFDRYLESLDPTKVYFTADEVAEFEPYRERLDDALRRTDTEAAFEIFRAFRQRVDRRSRFAIDLLEGEFDFAADETLPVRDEESTWFSTAEQLDNYWRKRVKNDVLNLRLSDKPEEEVVDTLTRRYQRQADRIHQMVADDVFEIFMNAYSLEVEPHTSYFSKRTAENFRIRLSLSLEGIGAALQTDLDYITVNRVIPGGPADKSNAIHAEDRIVGVGQGALDSTDSEEMINVIGWRLMDVVEMIRGSKGSIVRLEVLPKDSPPGAAPKLVQLVRDKIELEEQAAKRSDVEIEHGGEARKLAVISIPSFYSDFDARANNEKDYRSSTRDVRRLLEEIDPDSVDGLVIDLRNNGGGSLEEATSLTGLFIKSGPIVQIRYSNDQVEVKRDPDSDVVYDGPLAVLVNRYSASASEIFAGAIQDYGRGLIIGERTYGKGTVQQLLDLRQWTRRKEDLGQFKFTTAQFFRVSGNSTQNRGVEPDVMLDLGEGEEDYGERSLDNALPWALIQPARYNGDALPSISVGKLDQKHQMRTARNPAFVYLREANRSAQETRDIKEISLIEQDRVAERKRLEQEGLVRLNTYRSHLGLEPVTIDTASDSELPGGDEHWNGVIHEEASKILMDSLSIKQLTAHTAWQTTPAIQLD